MTEPRFIHLRVHSDYSIVDGIAKVNSLIEKAVKLGMPALAITDFTNLFGLIKFYTIAHNVGIKPIIGADFHVQSKFFNDNLTQLTILAMNNIGYQNLILLISKAYQRGYNAKGPWIDRDWLIELNEGLLLISGARMGEIGRVLLQKNSIVMDQCIKFYQKYFFNRFYLELTRTDRPEEENYINAAVSFAKIYDLPVVATNDVRFINIEDFEAHEIRVAIQDNFILDDVKRPRNFSPKQYMRSEDEMCRLFHDIPSALKNSVEIAKRCNVIIRLGEYFLPNFPTGNTTAKNFLIKKSKEGLEERLKFLFPDKNQREKDRLIYDKRLEVELQIINQIGFPSYFLIVMEFIQWSKDNGIPVGPGRGSGAGSLVAYALNITDLDPLKFDLLFERFLNPERISMPDFDIDFCMDKRDQVIEHVANMYGREAVSQIITFGTMAARAVIRDVGRILGLSYKLIDHISKLIPLDPNITLTKAFEIEPQLEKIYQENEEVKELIDMARKLEGIIRNVSKHAGGVVIAPTKITDFVPLYYDENGKHPVTQFDKNDIEHVGLVKFDFLGLRTLTIIDSTLKMINKQRKKNGELFLDITTIPLDDKKSFNMLKRAETTAVFQLESRGMKDLIKRLQPDCFEDMIALVALFRPGPLQSGMVDNFINRKHGYEKISYPDAKWQHESLKPVLESTYGIILYQEQVMQIAQVLSNYTLGHADILRRAMGKKKPEEMIKQRAIFEVGAKKNGIDGKLAIKIFDLVEKFADYGFNKSHSAAYAFISYQTLWLKANYPSEFMSAAMNADIDNTEKIVKLINECWRMGLKILPPDINTGLYYFHINDYKEIMYGIGAIKGIGKNTIEAIIQTRKKDGNFLEFFDFCIRTGTKRLNRRILEKLILSGALDKLGSHRALMMNSIGNALKVTNQYSRAEKIGQIDMFDTSMRYLEQTDKQFYVNCKPWSKQVILDGEHKTLGLYLTGHPIDQYLQEIKHYTCNNIKLKDVCSIKKGSIITIAGLLISLKIKVTKNGNRVGVCTLDDRSGRLEVILFNDVLNTYKHLLEKDRLIIVSGKISLNNFSGETKIISHEIMNINTARNKYVRGLTISITDRKIDNQFLDQIHKSLEPYCSGNIPVYLYYVKKNVLVRFSKIWNVTLNDHLINDLYDLVGLERIRLEFN